MISRKKPCRYCQKEINGVTNKAIQITETIYEVLALRHLKDQGLIDATDPFYFLREHSLISSVFRVNEGYITSKGYHITE
jgi:hypothetical protein